MSIKDDPQNEGWRSPQVPDTERKVDMRTKEGRAMKAAAQQAREAEDASRQERTKITEEQNRQISGAVGNMNQSQLDRRNAIADALDSTEDRKMQDIDGDKVVEEPVVEAAEPTPEPAEEPKDDAQEVHAEPRKFKLKVNGKEQEVTEEELIERAQKVASADEYLQTAAKALEGAHALAPSKDEPASNGEDVTEDTLTSALQGDAEAIKKVAQRLKAPPVKDVLTAVDDRLSFRSAVDWFQGEYKDLTADPMLYQLVVQEDSRIAQSEPTMQYRERLKKAGDKVRSWKEGIAPKTPVNPKLTAKASVAPVPQAAARQAPRDEEEDTEEPVESVIDKMAQARHQNGALRK